MQPRNWAEVFRRFLSQRDQQGGEGQGRSAGTHEKRGLFQVHAFQGAIQITQRGDGQAAATDVLGLRPIRVVAVARGVVEHHVQSVQAAGN